MDKFIAKKELEKEHETVINVNKLSRLMQAKNPDQMKEIMKKKVTQDEEPEDSKKGQEVVKKLFKKVSAGEQVVPDDKLIRGSFKKNWIYRPAPVQRDIYSKDFAYKEKDEEYNIWCVFYILSIL